MRAKMELLKDIKRHSYAPEDPEYRRLLTRLRKSLSYQTITIVCTVIFDCLPIRQGHILAPSGKLFTVNIHLIAHQRRASLRCLSETQNSQQSKNAEVNLLISRSYSIVRPSRLEEFQTKIFNFLEKPKCKSGSDSISFAHGPDWAAQSVVF